MNSNVEKVCPICSKIIGTGTPIMWYNNEPFHDSCFYNYYVGPTTYEQACKDVGDKSFIIEPNEKMLDLRDPEFLKTLPTLNPTLAQVKSLTGDCEDRFEKSTPKRIPWNQYFMEIADKVSTRSTCSRKHCGALVVRNNRILGHGYNGSMPGEPHCDDVGHFLVNNSCKRTSHAEINALEDAKTKSNDLKDCIMYTNTYPCIACFWAIMKSGIKKIYYKDSYAGYVADEDMKKVSETFGITIEKVEMDS